MFSVPRVSRHKDDFVAVERPQVTEHLVLTPNMTLDRRKSHLLRALFAVTFALLFYSYGMATVSLRIFPYGIVRDAGLALDALVDVYSPRDVRPASPSGATGSEQPVTAADDAILPVVHNDAGTLGDELILVSGGQNYLTTQGGEHGCLAWLMDHAGSIKHTWQYDPHLWDDLENVATVPVASILYPVGLHLYDDGSLLVSFQGESCFPFAVGLAKFDRHSHLIWKKELFHHWFTVGADGRIYVPSVRIVTAPVQIGGTRAKIDCDTQKILSDTVSILDPHGNLVEEISILEALEKSGWVGVFQGAHPELTDVKTDDPTHLNDVRLVDQDLAANYERLAVGDLLVSLRNINAIGILDAKTRLFKWMSVGRTLRQHSPRFYEGGILVLDNLGGLVTEGGSRLVRVDLLTGTSEVVFPQATTVLPDTFFTESAGHLDINQDGRRVLVTLTHKAEIWEIDLRSGQVLWRYAYHAPAAGETGQPRPRGALWKPLFTAKYVGKTQHARFPLNHERGNP